MSTQLSLICLCPNTQVSNCELKCKFELIFILFANDTNFLCREFERTIVYCRNSLLSFFGKLNYTQNKSVVRWRESVTITVRKCTRRTSTLNE